MWHEMLDQIDSCCYVVILSKIIQDKAVNYYRLITAVKMDDRIRTTAGRRLEGAHAPSSEVWQIKQKRQPKCKHATLKEITLLF